MRALQRLAKGGNKSARALDAFNPDQPRDDHGRWGEGAQTKEKGQMAIITGGLARGLSKKAHAVSTPEATTRYRAEYQRRVETGLYKK